MADRIDAIIPYAHVADVARSVEFYRRLGLAVINTYNPEGELLGVSRQRRRRAAHGRYMPAGEFRVEDPDGYVSLVGQPDDG